MTAHKILHVLDHSFPIDDGYSFRSAALFEGQRRLGWQTVHLTSAKQGPSRDSCERYSGLEFHRTEPSTRRCDRWPVLEQISVVRTLRSRVAQLVHAERPTVIHAHSPVLTALAALPVARRRGLPFVYEMRALWEDGAVDHGTARRGGLRYRTSRALETHVLRRADAVTTICEGLRKEIVARGVAAERVTVVPNGVDLARFGTRRPADSALVAQLGLSGRRVLGYIGSFYGYEGLAVLLRALPAIVAACPQAHLLLVGGGYEDVNLRAQARQLGVEPHVTFAGRVPHAEVDRHYDLIEVLVYPRLSTRLTELVTPLKPLEAMAQRRLVLASDVGGHRELIEDRRTGFLFRAGDPADLARVALDLLEHTERTRAVREAAYAQVARDRVWERSVAHYIEVYDRVTRRGAGS